MNYDKDSFLAGVAVGRQLKGWGVASGTSSPLWTADPEWLVVQSGVFCTFTTPWGVAENYDKTNPGLAICGFYKYPYDGLFWTSPILVSTDRSYIDYIRSDEPSASPGYGGSFTMYGLTWHHTGTGVSQRDDWISSITHPFPSVTLSRYDPRDAAVAILQAANVRVH